MLRRVIQAILVYSFGYQPNEVTAALTYLCPDVGFGPLGVHLSEHRLSRHNMNVYTYRRVPSDIEIASLDSECTFRDEVLSGKVLKTAGEQFLRAALIRSAQFCEVTQRERLGYDRDGDGAASDIVAVRKLDGVLLVISVKNRNEWIYGGDRIIDDAWARAKAYGGQPVLAAPFFHREGLDRCRRDGVWAIPLGGQVVPRTVHIGGVRRRVSTLLVEMGGVLGPQPYIRFNGRISENCSLTADVLSLLVSSS